MKNLRKFQIAKCVGKERGIKSESVKDPLSLSEERRWRWKEGVNNKDRAGRAVWDDLTIS